MHKSTLLQVFVYGTLKPGYGNYRRYCEARINFSQSAYTHGYLYDLPFGYPAMVVGEGKVFGCLLGFPDTSPLKDLDYLEDYSPDSPSPWGYTRHLVPVYSLDEKYLTQAWAYFMTQQQIDKCGGKLLVSGSWS